jgi:hypothetical protein
MTTTYNGLPDSTGAHEAPAIIVPEGGEKRTKESIAIMTRKLADYTAFLNKYGIIAEHDTDTPNTRSAYIHAAWTFFSDMVMSAVDAQKVEKTTNGDLTIGTSGASNGACILESGGVPMLSASNAILSAKNALLEPSSASVVPCKIKGASAQSADLLEVLSSADAVLAYISSAGKIFASKCLEVTAATAASVAETIRAAGSQSANIWELYDASAALAAYFTSESKLTLVNLLNLLGNLKLHGATTQHISQTNAQDLKIEVTEGKNVGIGSITAGDAITVNTSADTVTFNGYGLSGGTTALVSPTIESEFSASTTVKYGKMAGGWVCLMGSVTRVGGGPGDEIFTLQPGYHPSAQRVFEGADYDTIEINTDGRVVPLPGAGSTSVLDGIIFYADGS